MKKVSIVPLEVIVRNIAAGSLATRLGLPEGTKLQKTVLGFCYNDDELGEPMVNSYHIAAMGWATEEELSFPITASRSTISSQPISKSLRSS